MSVIGLDLGTSRVKAVRFDAGWLAADAASEPTAVLRDDSGRSEQDMRNVWAAAARVLAAVAARSPDRVELVALTAQGDGCWLVDRRGEPVRPAMLWNDSRAAAVVDRWAADGVLDRAFRINGCYGAPGLASAQLVWLAEHEPEALDRAAVLLSCGSWVYSRLTGRHVLEVSDAANPFLDAATRRYDPRLLEEFGLDGRAGLLPELVDGPDRVAGLTAAAAAELGLPVGTPVALAPYDVPATARGTGTYATGEAFAVLGTTLCVGLVADSPRLDRDPNGMTLPGPALDRWLIAYATMTGTQALDWAAGLLGLGSADAVVELAATAPARSGDAMPLLLPYLSPAGERSPFRDSAVRGSIFGLSLADGPAELARSVVDGLTLAVRDCMAAAGAAAGARLCGGGARSALWCQSISDALGVPLTGPGTPEVGALGAAIIGAVDAGLLASAEESRAVTAGAGRAYFPDPVETARFDQAYERFTRMRDASRS